MTDGVSSPGELMSAIDRAARDLDACGRQLAKALRDLGSLERDYEREMESAKLSIFHESQAKGSRMPPEDLRTALAHQKVNTEVYAKFLTGRAEVKALTAWGRALEHAMMGRQSLLNVMRAELRAGV